ncbi:MAG: hypothetical protein ACPGOV_13285 [Magnetovibrionaceae bacterium]
MIDAFPFAGFTVAIYGLDENGIAAARSMMVAEADVWAWDDNEDRRAEARKWDIPLVNLHMANWKEPVSLVISPAIAHGKKGADPIVKMARKAGAEVIGDVEVLARTQRDAEFIGITGGRGKATTAAMLHHIINVSGGEAEVGGMPGAPALSTFGLGVEGKYVLSMPPEQLDLTVSITFDVAILLNDLGLESRTAEMMGIFHRQTDPRSAVIGIDSEATFAIFEGLKTKAEQKVVPISVTKPAIGGVYASEGWLYDDMDGQNVKVMSFEDLDGMDGLHNQQNAVAAYAAARCTGIQAHQAMACLQSYAGITHRQEWVATIDGVDYLNDARADNPSLVATSISPYDKVYWIGGGRNGITQDWSPVAGQAGLLKKAITFGAAAGEIEEQLGASCTIERAESLEAAVQRARDLALEETGEGAVVMLSPGTPAGPALGGFQDRGDAFKDLVEALPGERLED